MSEMTWKDAIRTVLEEAGQAMHTREITEAIVERGLRTSFGATPGATVGSHCYAAAKENDPRLPVIQTGKGEFILKKPEGESSIETASESEEEAGGIIQAFGMYWNRSSVHWTRNCAILGRQQIGADSVDFCGQLGVYLLHDGREVVYVGRSTDRPLGVRLYEHTADRLKTRWNRFSWFGLRPVHEDGSLTDAAAAGFSAADIISALEAVLIEGLEPRQNRRRGDDLSAVEYLQAEDPEIERQQMRSLLAEMQEKLSKE